MDADGTDAEEAADFDNHSSPVHILSCEQCRHRKVRCDKKEPCGPCGRKQIACTFPAGFKPRQRRQRALVSNSYEDKIDDISRKLDRICSLVDRNGLASTQTQDGPLSGQTNFVAHKTPGSFNSSPVPHTQSSEDASGSDYEGELSLTAHATFATNFAQQAVNNNHPLKISQEVASSLDALRRTLVTNEDRSERSRVLHAQLIPPSSIVDGLQMPPINLAMAAVQSLRSSARARIFCCLEFESIGQFVEYFFTVYSGQPSIADLIIVNCSLERLLIEYGNGEADEARKNEFTSQGLLCRRNMESILARLPFNLPMSLDFSLALLMASTYYLEISKPSMAWNCVAAASQMSQALGFHRDVPLKPENPETRRRRTKLFWCIFLLDKTLALRLGRSSTIRDCDVTLPRMDVETVADGQLDAVLPKWIDIAILHGKVYDDIYSPGALLQPEGIRVTRARALASEMQRVFEGESPAETRYLEGRRRALGNSTHELLKRADRISYLADLTLIYRSIPSGPYSTSAFCDECIATANRGLEEHKKCIVLLRDIEGDVLELYIQWALLSSPFVPFIVIFCHVIETAAPLHLEKLAAVVETLQMLPPDYPEAYKKQLHLFKRMYDVACKYVEAAASGQAQGGYEAFFKEAGIALPNNQMLQMPDPSQQNPQMNPGVGFGVGMGSIEGADEGLVSNMENPSFELGNWFDQNYQILKMMEDGV
ncbi:fungal-specific transcription factor domain-containing protein [Dactylonectria macrodidyma]|uniref:Fungal-specific transcription factor domain-containing protein n=1 Tax=Dactylonectria macrodidyma TaxID=307937 RepID=A0A9P9J2G0_9HYPO|nr:fungal-specific transcription factor domain-containing protein [Dactylonectria macrodidyma]